MLQFSLTKKILIWVVVAVGFLFAMPNGFYSRVESVNDARMQLENGYTDPEIVKTASVDEAISTVGGIDLKAVSENFELKKMSNQFCIGEMLDWDAPTGGYLLQACGSTGVYLAKHLNKID